MSGTTVPVRDHGPQSLVLMLMAIPASLYIIQLMVAVPKLGGAMSKFGVCVPKQDASWEREPNGFAELMQRHKSCDAKVCDCRQGRFHTIAGTRWEILLCRYCASKDFHVKCRNLNRLNTE